MHPDIISAYKIFEGEVLTPEIAARLLVLPAEYVMDIISLAGKVRNRFSPAEHICTITNAKSGRCSQDCRYCAQSAHHSAEIESYSLRPVDSILRDAEQTVANGVKHFGVVTSGYGFPEWNSEFDRILETIHRIREEFPLLKVCASLGVLSEPTARGLADSGIVHYNHNLQVNPSNYARLVSTTHSIEERINTLLLMKRMGVKICAGAIFGLGESDRDRLELAFVLRELDVDVVPLNVLVPIPGTPLENAEPVSVIKVARMFALYRLILPKKIIKFAAGRETVMKDYQGLLMLAGVNGILTGGYLTTRGRTAAEDLALLQETGKFYPTTSPSIEISG